MVTPKAIVLVSGVKIRDTAHEFPCPTAAKVIEHSGRKFKWNTAAGVALALNRAGYHVHMVGFSEEDLTLVAHYTANPSLVSYEVADLLMKSDANQVALSAKELMVAKGLPLHVVHYGGASTTTQPLPHDTVFLGTLETPPEAAAALIRDNCETFLQLYQALRPLFANQAVTKVMSITSIASTRCKTGFALDALQKGAMHNLLRSAALDETRNGIYITEIMPGITDTGYYDNPETLRRSLAQARELGYEWQKEDFPLFTPEHVGETVRFALEFPGHMREISMIPYGQYPHLGA